MTIQSSISRIAATVVAMLQTRIELVSVELEEELVRFSTYFIATLIALFCAGVAVTLGIFLVIALYWDEHRIAVLLTLIGIFSVTSVALAAWVRNQFMTKPRLLENSIAELKKDAELISLRSDDKLDEQEQA
jgi:uncharacterized membrane protein YqjE